jgi:hypothetical protein
MLLFPPAEANRRTEIIHGLPRLLRFKSACILYLGTPWVILSTVFLFALPNL